MEDLFEGRVLRRSHFPKKNSQHAYKVAYLRNIPWTLQRQSQIPRFLIGQNLAASVVPFSRARPCLPFEWLEATSAVSDVLLQYNICAWTVSLEGM